MKEIDGKIEVVDTIECNMCGNPIVKSEADRYEYATTHASWGYGAEHDGEKFTLEICEDCIYRRLLPVCKIKPEITESI
jgi:hypothetical protein